MLKTLKTLKSPALFQIPQFGMDVPAASDKIGA
jgi:hypothetical protein